jgi:hypothetical protein
LRNRFGRRPDRRLRTRRRRLSRWLLLGSPRRPCGRRGGASRCAGDRAQPRHRGRHRCGSRSRFWRRGRRGRRGCRSCFRLGRRLLAWLEHAADQISDLIRHDAQLVFGLENAAQAFIEERRQLFRGEPDLFGELEDPYFSGQVYSRARGARVPSVGVRGAPTDGLAPLGNQRFALIGGNGRHESLRLLCTRLSIKPYSAAAAPSPGYRRFLRARSAHEAEQRYAPRPGCLRAPASACQPAALRTNRTNSFWPNRLRQPTQVRTGTMRLRFQVVRAGTPRAYG